MALEHPSASVRVSAVEQLARTLSQLVENRGDAGSPGVIPEVSYCMSGHVISVSSGCARGTVLALQAMLGYRVALLRHVDNSTSPCLY